MKLTRHGAARALTAGLLAGIAGLAAAQEYPNKPIKVLVPYAAGGTPDVVARFQANLLNATLGQPITVENKPGAGGLPAVQELMRSAPDGYTFMIADVGQYAIVPAMRPGVYDPIKDLQPLVQTMTNSVFLMSNTSIPVNNMKDLIALIKANPGKYSYGSPGIGTIHHLFMEATKIAYGLDVQHVPFKGSSQTIISLLNGDVAMCICGVTTTQQQIKEGKIKVFAASTKERDMKLAPDVPSASEFGAPDLDFGAPSGYFAPAGTPRPIVEKLSAALARAVQSPEFAARAPALGTIVEYRNTAQWTELVHSAYPRYVRVVKLAGIKPQ